MEKKSIQKLIEIKATKEKVWKVLTEQPYLDDWTSAFMQGSHVEGNFEDGSQILYLGPDKMGVVGKIMELKPNEFLRIDILAEVTNGAPDFDNPDSKRWEGAYDEYKISEKDGVSTLSVESAFPAEFYDDFVPGWQKMVEKVKELSEK